MAGPAQDAPASLRDRAWRMAFRIGFPLARVWWRLRRRPHEGALVAIYVGRALLLVRSSYRREWNLPGGGVKRGETPEAAARRELVEELGLVAGTLTPSGETRGWWEGRHHRVFFFEWRLDELPVLRLDNREIIAAQLVTPDALRRFALTGSVAAYVTRRVVAGARD